MLRHVHKVVHLVVSTFEQGLKSGEELGISLPPVELAKQDSVLFVKMKC